ncbi:MAG: diguanylate cyclase, partial [Leptospiraceae bacterium]|nr:diguanylate cyclase [Leptospiraceae bacterium]
SQKKINSNKNNIEEILKEIYNSIDNPAGKIFYFSSKTGLKVYPPINYLKQEGLNLNLHLPHYLPKSRKIVNSDKNVFWSKPHESLLEENQDWVVDIFTPINRENPFDAFVGVSLSLSNLINQFSQLQQTRGNYSFIIDEKRNLIAAPPHARLELAPPEKFVPRGLIQLDDTGDKDFDETLKEMSLGRYSIQKVKIKNEVKYLAFHPLEEINWRLGVIVPVSTATSNSIYLYNIIRNAMKRAFLLMGIGAILTLVISIIIGGILIRKLLKPLQLVSTVSKSIAEGNFEKRVEIYSHDEIGSLANVFNRMADQIQNLFVHLDSRARELEHLNSSLEQKVELRTKELLNSKTDLEKANELLKSEVSEREVAEKKLLIANNALEKLARIDGLTGIANRRYLDEKLNEEWARLKREKSPISFILFDVDYFKLYNDNYGHQAGDICLVKVAQICLQTLKRPSDIIGRYGGEEFAIILPHTKEKGAIKIVQEIQESLKNNPIPHEYSPISDLVTLSFGINSIYPSPNSSGIDELISNADKALYNSKRQGRNKYSVYQN